MNNEHFETSKLQSRSGSQTDVQNLQKLAEQLGMRSVTENDHTGLQYADLTADVSVSW